MQYQYTVQKLHEAVDILAVGDASAKERVHKAWAPIRTLSVGHWPTEAAVERRKLEELMARGEEMSNSEACDAARATVSLLVMAVEARTAPPPTPRG